MNFVEKNIIKRDYFLYFLLFFTPLINFIINNLFFYNIDYFFDICIVFVVFYLIITIFFTSLSYVNINFEKYGYAFFLTWYFQFYYRDIYNFFELDFNGDQIQKYFIVIFLIILSFSILYLSKIKKFRYFLKIFLIVFLFLNLFSNFYISQPSNWKYKADNQFLVKFKELSNSTNKKNIYFFLMDEMTSTKVYQDMGLEISGYIKNYESKGYKDFKNIYSNYNGSQITIGSLFNLDYYPTEKSIKEQYFYPYNLYNKEKPLLMKILENLKYNFWYLDNQYMKCKNINNIQCINETDESYFHKILFDEALNIFFYKSFLNKFFYKYKFNTMNKIFKNTEIDYFKKFLKNNSDVISKKNNFFFIHQMNPHYPFRNNNCDVLNKPYEVNLENYLSSSVCAFSKINEITDLIEAFDNEAIVIFQGDHGFSQFSKNNPQDYRSYEIFNLVKGGSNCNLNYEHSLGNVEQLRSILLCSFGKKYTSRSSKKYYVKKRLKKIGTILDEVN